LGDRDELTFFFICPPLVSSRPPRGDEAGARRPLGECHHQEATPGGSAQYKIALFTTRMRGVRLKDRQRIRKHRRRLVE
jgi:hypothetical protein